MAGDPGYESKMVEDAGHGSAVPFVAGVAQTAGQEVLVDCTTAGTLILHTRHGQTITLHPIVDITRIPLSCTQMDASTFVGTAFNVF